MAKVYLGLGANTGDRRQNLITALAYLRERMRIKRVSSVYETEPMYIIRQPRFLNMACEVDTPLMPYKLLDLVKGIERTMGRQPGLPNSPRPIDIDILFYDKEVINLPDLVIPHPGIAERAFVLAPLAEIAPGIVHPVTRQKIRELLPESDRSGVTKWENKR